MEKCQNPWIPIDSLPRRLCLVLTMVTRVGTEISVSLRTLNYGDSSFIKYIHRFLVLRTSSEASPPSSKKYHVVLKWLETSCDPVNPQTPRLHTEPTYGYGFTAE